LINIVVKATSFGRLFNFTTIVIIQGNYHTVRWIFRVIINLGVLLKLIVLFFYRTSTANFLKQRITIIFPGSQCVSVWMWYNKTDDTWLLDVCSIIECSFHTLSLDVEFLFFTTPLDPEAVLLPHFCSPSCTHFRL
jgi:hypothetical protein